VTRRSNHGHVKTILPHGILDIEQLVCTLEHLNRSDIAVPVVRSPLKTEGAIPTTILMARNAALHIARVHDRRGIRVQVREGHPNLVVVAMSPNNGIEAKVAVQPPHGTEKPCFRAQQLVYCDPLKGESR
jgi:hypothetical protein